MRRACTLLRQRCPSEVATEKHRGYGVARQIEYVDLDALNISCTEAFDVVLFKSVLGGIGRGNQKDRQRKAVAEMYRSLKPGGELWFAENLVASPLHRLLRRRWVQWGMQWRYITVREMLEFLSPFSMVNYTTVGFLGALGRNARQRTLLGRLDRLGFDRLISEAWHYIIIGVAHK